MLSSSLFSSFSSANISASAIAIKASIPPSKNCRSTALARATFSTNVSTVDSHFDIFNFFVEAAKGAGEDKDETGDVDGGDNAVDGITCCLDTITLS